MKLFVLSALFLFGCLTVVAQPGGYAVFVTVVDGSGEPIRDAWVKVIPSRTGGRSFINPSLSPSSIFERAFLPTDGSHSRFAASIVLRGKGEYDVEATAEGFHPLRKTILIDRVSPEHTFVLEPNGEPRPKLEPLVTLSGRLTNTFGEPLGGMRVKGPGGYFYSTVWDAKGNYSIKLVPGDYRIEFWPASCVRYTLEDYPIGRADKVLNLTTECKYRRGADGSK